VGAGYGVPNLPPHAVFKTVSKERAGKGIFTNLTINNYNEKVLRPY